MYRATITINDNITFRNVGSDKGQLLSDLNDDLQLIFPDGTTVMKTKDGVTTLTIVDDEWNELISGTVEEIPDEVVVKSEIFSKTLGEMTEEERDATIGKAFALLKKELEQNSPALSKLMEEDPGAGK